MAIEFSCTHCGKVLKTKDDKAGMTARCPDCGGTVTVPPLEGGGPTPPALPGSESRGPWETPGSGPKHRQADSANDLGDEALGGDDADIGAEMKACPMCGKEIRAAARVCRYCGERLAGDVNSLGVHPTPVESGRVIGDAWNLFKHQGGMMVVGMLVFVGIQVVGFLILYFATIATVVGLAQAVQKPDPMMFIIGGVAIGIPLLLLIFAASTYLQLGFTIFTLNIAKGREPNIGDIFSGGPHLWRGLAMALLLAMLGAGIYVISFAPMFLLPALQIRDEGIALVCMLGGQVLYYSLIAFVQMRFMPANYHLVEQSSGPLEALSASWSLTSCNLLTQFVLVPVMFVGLYLLGLMMCCVGVIATLPFFFLIQGVGYVSMCGRKIRYVD